MMKKIEQFFLIMFIYLISFDDLIYAINFIPASNPDIQYYGRWDMSDSLNFKHSWPGIYIFAEFKGTSIGVRMDDSVNYYNVYIDGKFFKIFHSHMGGERDYILADSLTNTHHIFRISQRNISFGVYSFGGLLIDDGAKLLPLSPKPSRKIEFIGNSFTAAEGNEASQADMQWEAKFPVTNIDKGFAPIIARHFNAQFHTICRSGIGMVCNWQGKYDISMSHYFDRTLMESEDPKWDFKKWIPNLVVICLGLNDYAGLKDKNGGVSEKNSEIFRNVYHKFLKTVREMYPGVLILAVSASNAWIRKNVRKVVNEEYANGHFDIYCAQFDHFSNGYVANGHPTVATHKKIADEIIKSIDKYDLFPRD